MTSASTRAVRRRNQQSGFTLLEVLVATVIMAIAVAGVFSGLAASTRNAARVTEYDRGAMLARMKMDELLVDDRTPRDVAFGGRFLPAESGGVEAGWQAQVNVFESTIPNPGPGTVVVDRIELEIWWMEAQTRRSFTLEGFRRARILPPDLPPEELP